MSNLCQFPTPVWVAAALVERHFPGLDHGDCVIDPTCGPGAFLEAIPTHVPAIGVDVDPELAALARSNTGRRVVEGDFLTVALDFAPTAIIGNPPFRSAFLDPFLRRYSDFVAIETGRYRLAEAA